MTQISRVKSIRYAKHTSAYVFDNTPGTLVDLYIKADDLVNEGPGFVPVERDYAVIDGEYIASARGKPSIELSGFSMPINALSDGAEGVETGDTDSSGFTTAVDDMLELCLGSKVDGAGAAAASSPGSGTTLTVDAGVVPVAGDGILIDRASDGAYIARECQAVSGTTITLDVQPLATDGSATTPTASTAVFGSRRFAADPDAVNRTHLYFDIERETGRNRYFGCCPTSAKITYAHGQQLMLEIGGFKVTSRTDSSSDADPSYTAPTQGAEIIAQPVFVTIDGTLYMAYDVEIDLGIEVVERKNDGQATGASGCVFTRTQPVATFKILEGASTTPTEATHSQLNTWRGTAHDEVLTYDVGMQFGGGATVFTPAAYARMIDASCMFERISENGLDVIQVTAKATKSSNHSNVAGGFRFHVF